MPAASSHLPHWDGAAAATLGLLWGPIYGHLWAAASSHLPHVRMPTHALWVRLSVSPSACLSAGLHVHVHVCVRACAHVRVCVGAYVRVRMWVGMCM